MVIVVMDPQEQCSISNGDGRVHQGRCNIQGIIYLRNLVEWVHNSGNDTFPRRGCNPAEVDHREISVSLHTYSLNELINLIIYQYLQGHVIEWDRRQIGDYE
jgi:hypothetical protein